jgi:hypothetical protein
MKNTRLKYPLLGTLAVATLLFSRLAPAQPVDPPPSPPVDVLAEETGPVIVGRVQAIYSYQVQRNGVVWSRMAAEVAVNHVERGPEFEVGDLAYVRYWVGRRGNRRLGQFPAPRPGDTVRVVLAQRPDGGCDVASSGFEILRVRDLARPVLPDPPDAQPVPPEPRPADPLASGPVNTIRGTVVHYDDPQPGVTVDLLAAGGVVQTGRTDERGRFVFDGVPAGAYSVAAQGIVKNKIRESSVMPITVLPSPAVPTDVVVGLEP